MRWALTILLISSSVVLSGCPPATPPPPPEQACIWQSDQSEVATAELVLPPRNTGASEPITADNVGRVRELSRLGRGQVYGVYPGPYPNTAVILSDAGVEIYDTDLGQTLRQFHHIEPVTGDAVSPDGRFLVSRNDYRLRLWGLTDGRLLCDADVTPYRGISYLAWSPDGKLVAAAMYDGTTWVWNPDSGRDDLQVLGTWRPRGLALDPRVITPITVAWSPDGRDVAFTNDDHVLEIWDISEPEPRLQLSTPRDADQDEFPRPIDSFVWSSDGDCVRLNWKDGSSAAVDAISGESCGEVKEWEPAQPTRVVSTELLSFGQGQAVWSPDGTELAIGLEDRVLLWDSTSRTFQGEWPAPTGTYIRHIQWLADGLYRLVSPVSLEAEWKLAWDRLDSASAVKPVKADGKLNVLERLDKLDDYALAFSPDGSNLAARALDHASFSSALHVWDLTSNAGRTVLEVPEFSHGKGISWSPDGALLAVAFGKDPTRILDASSWQAMASVPGNGFIWAPDGKRIAARCAPEGGSPEPGRAQLCIYDAATGQALGPQLIASDVSAIEGAWSPDGKLLAVADGSELRIWGIEPAKLLHTLHSTDGWYDLAWSPESRMLASGRGPVHIWGIPAKAD